VETFMEPRAFVENPRYGQDRKIALAALDLGSIDEPIVQIVAGFAALPHCFTLQSCYGHFLCSPDQAPRSLARIPPQISGMVRYRIAYIAFCIENSDRGRTLCRSLERIPSIDPDFVQYGSAKWFWERWVNSFALQVEPNRYMSQDEAVLEQTEALHIQQTRDTFFRELRELLAGELRECGAA
jgi:hypothetical protein